MLCVVELVCGDFRCVGEVCWELACVCSRGSLCLFLFVLFRFGCAFCEFLVFLCTFFDVFDVFDVFCVLFVIIVTAFSRFSDFPFSVCVVFSVFFCF